MSSIMQKLGKGLSLGLLGTFLLVPSVAAQNDWQQKVKQGHLAMSQGNYKQALSLLDQVLADNPNAWEAYLKRAQIYAKMGNHAATIQNYNQVTTLNPRLATVWLDRYTYFMTRNMPQQAEYDLTEGLRLLPANPDLNYAYAVHLLKKGDKATALSVLQTLQALQPSPIHTGGASPAAVFVKGSTLRARLYAENQALGAYGQELHFLINAQPQVAKLYWNRALWYKNYARDLASAKSDLNSYLYLAPKDALAYALRAELNLAGSLCKDALADLKTACKLGDKKSCYTQAPCQTPAEKPEEIPAEAVSTAVKPS